MASNFTAEAGHEALSGNGNGAALDAPIDPIPQAAATPDVTAAKLEAQEETVTPPDPPPGMLQFAGCMCSAENI